MEIEFLKDHLYFKKGQIIRLADFTVLTGRNGAGKTNLLRAIYGRDISLIDEMPLGDLFIEYFNFNSFDYTLNNERFGTYAESDSNLNRTWLDYKLFLNDELEETPQMKQIAEHSGKNIKELIKEDFVSLPISRINEQLKLFELNFFKDSALYIRHQEGNKFNSFRNVNYDENNLIFSEEEFLQRYGQPPWEKINKIFEDIGLPYEFETPNILKRNEPIYVQLIDKVNNEKVDVKDFSNGERTILTIATVIYNSKIVSNMPNVFLFDEPDALLHPEYSKKLIYILNDYLVGKLGAKVIMTTHSPSTLAITPEESIFICEKKSFKVRKVSKDEALRQLTLNVNSLSILHENRRQIFVEDVTDAKIFESIYLKLNARLHPEISLNFIPVTKTSIGGCDKVKEITKSLYDGGNKTVFGVIDWDVKNKSNDYIFVLGENKRYSIENYLLDPILFYSLLLREKIIPCKKLKKSTDHTYMNFNQANDKDLQKVVDSIVEFSKKNKSDNANEENIEVKYIGGRIVNIPRWFLEIRGHDLEEFFETSFPAIFGLKRKTNENLTGLILNNIIVDFPEFIPMEFLELFKKIQIKN